MTHFRILALLLYSILSFPFYVLNVLQRHLSKPWRFFLKQNSGNDVQNEEYRSYLEYAKIPLYIVLTPFRFVNAVYYNIVVHSLFECFNYLCEVIAPSNEKEGANNLTKWLLWLPFRIIKYPLFHGLLMLIESVVWVIVDTFVPPLTLYHGTDRNASSLIVGNPQSQEIPGKDAGGWLVGRGSLCGKGIYFVPDRTSARLYSSGSIIAARVSLGRVLDLGLVHKNVYKLCGKLFEDTTAVTDWGLKNGYVSGEWWNKTGKFWEYCLFDFQNRYNHSWRIRPLYVLDMQHTIIQRVPEGMTHWLFRSIVIKDIMTN